MQPSEQDFQDFEAYLNSSFPYADREKNGEKYTNFHTQKLWEAFYTAKYNSYCAERNFNRDFERIFGVK